MSGSLNLGLEYNGKGEIIRGNYPEIAHESKDASDRRHHNDRDTPEIENVSTKYDSILYMFLQYTILY